MTARRAQHTRNLNTTKKLTTYNLKSSTPRLFQGNESHRKNVLIGNAVICQLMIINSTQTFRKYQRRRQRRWRQPPQQQRQRRRWKKKLISRKNMKLKRTQNTQRTKKKKQNRRRNSYTLRKYIHTHHTLVQTSKNIHGYMIFDKIQYLAAIFFCFFHFFRDLLCFVKLAGLTGVNVYGLECS